MITHITDLIHNFGPEQATVLLSKWMIIAITAAIVCFLTGEITGNYSQVDKLWSLMPPLYGWVTFASSPSLRLLIMSLIVTIWGLRLSYNFYRKGGYSIVPWKGAEDYRWKIVRENRLLKGRFRSGLFNLLFISGYQHLIILLFSSPFLIAAMNPGSRPGYLDIAALFLMMLFIASEAIADNQQYRFHMEKSGKTEGEQKYAASVAQGFLSEGMWAFSRHPNFASEQAIWISFYLFAVSSSGNWLNPAIAGPILLILLFIGSSQLTEKISSAKYSAYADYQKSVPRFIPLPGLKSKTKQA